MTDPTTATPQNKTKTWLIQLLKCALAVALIYWLIHTKKITAEPFIRLWQAPWLIPFVFLVSFSVIVINNYRWLLLLRGQSIRSDARRTLPLSFIGLFFNLAMPGAVGGDVIKGYYITQDQPGTKVGAATSVLMDRIIGLYSMGFIALVAGLANWSAIMALPGMRPFVLLAFCVVCGGTAFFLVGFSERVRAHRLTHAALRALPGGRLQIGQKIERFYDAVHAFRHGKRQFYWGIVLSIASQSMSIASLYIVARNTGYPHVSFRSFFFIFPIGLMATAIPISPGGGIGVGQTVFAQLFAWYDPGLAPMGAALITIAQVAQAVLGLLGAYFYFARGAPVRRRAS